MLNTIDKELRVEAVSFSQKARLLVHPGECKLHALNTGLNRVHRTEWPNAPGIWNDDQAKGWSKVVDAVHKEGAKMFCQVRPYFELSNRDADVPRSCGMVSV
jgi:hypothetical protein